MKTNQPTNQPTVTFTMDFNIPLHLQRKMAIMIREFQNIVGLEVTKAYLGFLSRTIKPTVFNVINIPEGVFPSSALYLEEKDITFS
jgi:hypothetical protein